MDAQSPDNDASQEAEPNSESSGGSRVQDDWEIYDETNLLDFCNSWEETLDFMLRCLGKEQGLDDWIGML